MNGYIKKQALMDYCSNQVPRVIDLNDIARFPVAEVFTKDEVIGMFKDLQLEIKELWDNRYDVWLDNQYYIGKSDTLEEVDEVIQQKISELKEDHNNDEKT